MKNDKQTSNEELIPLAHQILADLNFKDMQLSHHGSILRIKVADADFELAINIREEIVKRIKEIGYHFVTLDMDDENPGED